MAPRRNSLPTADFESTGNRARSAGAGGPGTSGFNNRTVSDFSAGIGALNEMVQRIQLERDTVKAVGEESRITTEKAAEQAKLNPLDPDYQKQVADLWADAKKQVMQSGITSTAVLDDISKRMDRHGASMQVAAIGATKAATSKKAVLTYKDALDATNAKIRNDPSNANGFVDEFKADSERLKVGMDPLAFEEVSRKAADEMAKAQIIGYAEKGNYGAARNALKAQAPHLTNEMAMDLSRLIDGRETKARIDGDRARAAAASALTARMYDWAHGLGPPVPREDVDRFKNTPEYAAMVSTFGGATEKLKNKEDQKQERLLVEDARLRSADDRERERIIAQKAVDISARISDAQAGKGPMPSREEIEAFKVYRQYDELVKQHNQVEIQQRKVQLETQDALEAYQFGTMDGTEKQARLAFGALFGNVPFGQVAMQGTPEQKAQAIIAAATMASASGGVLPPQMKDLIANADATTDPRRAATVAFAAEAMDDFDVRAPGKMNGLSLSDTGVVARTRNEAKRLMADGVPKQEAYVAAAQSSMRTDNITIQQEVDLKARFKEESKTVNFPNAALNAVSDVFQRNIPFMAPEASATMGAEYRRIYEQAYVDTRGDKDRAKALADERMKKDYGVTKIGVTDARQEAAGPTAMEFGITPNYTGMEGGGKATVQKHPPERYMKAFFPQMSDDQLAKMVMADLDAFNAKEKIAPAPNKDAPGRAPVYLAPDATTEADLRAGRPLSYEYRVLRGEIYEPVISGTTGKPVRYRIPSSPDQVKENPAFMEAETARRARIEKAINLDIELKTAVPDPVADERAWRMKQEGKGLKGNR